MTERWASFDCYGTLIDWERGIMDAFVGLWPDVDPSELLEHYHEAEKQIERGSGAPYRDVLRATLRATADAAALTVAGGREDALSVSLPEWPPFPETTEALTELRERGWKLAILSNTDPGLLDASIRRMEIDIDLRITVAEAGSYKPAHGHWQRFVAETGVGSDRHVHVAASLFHDIAPARELGLRCVWINREAETTGLGPDAELPDLRGLADTLDALVGD